MLLTDDGPVEAVTLPTQLEQAVSFSLLEGDIKRHKLVLEQVNVDILVLNHAIV